MNIFLDEYVGHLVVIILQVPVLTEQLLFGITSLESLSVELVWRVMRMK